MREELFTERGTFLVANQLHGDSSYRLRPVLGRITTQDTIKSDINKALTLLKQGYSEDDVGCIGAR